MAHSTIEFLDSPAAHRAELVEYRGFDHYVQYSNPAQAPCLIQGRKQIALTFNVKQNTVREWKKEGAPFFLVGNMWQVDYRDMVEWLKKNKPPRNEPDCVG